MITMSALSTQYIQVPVDTTSDGFPYDPTADPVSMAFTVSGNPSDADWHTALWHDLPPTGYVVRCLVGPANGGVVLPVGLYGMWVRITDSPEVPVENAGLLNIV